MLGKGTVHVRFSLFARIACVAAVAALLLPALGSAGMAADRGLNFSSTDSGEHWNAYDAYDPTQPYQACIGIDKGESGNATGGKVTIDTGNESWSIYGGFSGTGSSPGDVNNNSVTMINGKASNIIGGGSYTGNVYNNTVTISGGTPTNVLGGNSTNGINVNNNTVTITGGEITGYVVGGYGPKNVNGNTVTISGGTITGNVSGGFSASGDSIGNTVTISGGTITGNVSGGQSGSAKNAKDNTVIYSGGTIGGNLYGGQTTGTTSGNKLVSIGNRTVDGAVDYFQNIHFVLGSNNAGLKVGGPFQFDDQGSKLAVDILGGGNRPEVGDQLMLAKAAGGVAARSDVLNATGTGKKGVSVLFDYKVDPLLGTSPTDDTTFTATVTKVHGAHPQAKSLLEGRIAGITTINQAGDMLAGKGIAAASAAVSSSGFGIYAATSGGTNRYKSGSHVDLDSISFMLGAGWRKNTGVGALLLSPFFEFGWGKYKAHNDNLGGFADVDAKGTTNYQGGGLLARYDHCSGFYGEGSFRLGRLHQSYDSSDLTDGAGRGSSYKYNQLYTSLHVGVGRKFALGMGELDVYGKYFWTRAGKKDITVRGDPISFAAANSHRMRLGARYTHAASEAVKPYVGAGFEYEFAGKAKAKTYRIFDINAPRIKGGSGLLEAGIDYTPVGAKWAINAGATGYVGKRRGIMGQLGVRADF